MFHGTVYELEIVYMLVCFVDSGLAVLFARNNFRCSREQIQKTPKQSMWSSYYLKTCFL